MAAPLPPAAVAALDELCPIFRTWEERRPREEPVAVERRSGLDRRGGALAVLPTLRTR